MGCAGSIPTTKPNDQILGLHQRLGVQMNQLVIAHEQNKEITTSNRHRVGALENIIDQSNKDVTRWRILATSYAKTYDRDFDRLADALEKLQRSQEKVWLQEQKIKEYELKEFERCEEHRDACKLVRAFAAKLNDDLKSEKIRSQNLQMKIQCSVCFEPVSVRIFLTRESYIFLVRFP